jgi:CheY-specific phosphatase CheX
MDMMKIRPFVVATDRVFRKVLGAPALLGKPTADRSLPSIGSAVAADVEVKDDVHFCVVIQFDREMARAVAEALPGEDAGGESEVRALREFTRLTIAAAKRNGAMKNASVSLIGAKNSEGASGLTHGAPPWLIFPFESAAGRLQLAVSVGDSKPVSALPLSSANN